MRCPACVDPWIPVTERMPEIPGDHGMGCSAHVLVKSGLYQYPARWIVMRTERGVRVEWGWDSGERNLPTPTHWRPI